jgi:serine protease Do
VETTTGTTAATAEGLITAMEDIGSATIQIVAEGTFVDPTLGAFESAGSGSGAIIDPSGLAVTNNHVVTGAGLLRVYVGGDPNPVNAKVLGVSECSDLAVIDLAGEGFPYFGWYEGDVTPGIEVFAAGYPLGDPEFTLTKGIVSKADITVETEWASVDHVIEHDARIRPGNSGGPLVTADGRIIGINYAGREDTDQNFAISFVEAGPIVQQLAGGTDVDSVGINGVAVYDEVTLVSGIWVSSVASGSAADRTGILPGDIVTRVEGISLATDGTVADYCDVIRTHDPNDVMLVEVTRNETGQVLEGQLNGDALVETFLFQDEISDEGGAETYGEYVIITDDTGAVQVEVPAEWADVDGAPYTDDAGNSIVDVRASSDLSAFASSWDVPGMILSASSDLIQSYDVNGYLDTFVSGLEGTCTYERRSPYSDPAYEGAYDYFTDCGGVGATYVVVAAAPPDGSFLIVVQVQANQDRDFEALDRILASFVATGEV